MSAASEQFATAESVGAGGPYHRVRVSRVVDETADARSFVLAIPEEAAEQFAYRAGQFLTFRLTVASERLVRCYSLASAPGVDREYKVTVKRVEDGRASNWMNDHLAPGDWLETMPPAGVFCLAERTTPLVLFGAGSGITPVISLIKSALADGDRPITLLYANQDRPSIIFREELDELVRRYPQRLEVIHHLDCDSGFIDAASVERAVGGRLDADCYVCGPGPFMDTVETAVEGLGVDRSQLFIERFMSLSGEGAAVPEQAGDLREGGDASPRTITVALDGETREVPYSPGQTLLAAFRAAGLEPPFACEEGYCSCCMAKLSRGRVRMLANDALPDDQVEQGWVLTCQSIPLDDEITVEYPD